VVTEQRIPLNYMNEHGEVVGDATKIVREILAHAGIAYSIQVYPWARAYNKAKTEPNTLIYSLRRTNKREDMFHWICPLIQSEKEYIYRLSTRHDINFSVMEAAKTYSLGVVRNDFTHETLRVRGFEDNKHLDINNDGFANLKKLIKGRVDLIVQSDRAIERSLKKLNLPLSTVTAIIPFELEQPTCIGLNIQTADKIVNQLRQSHKIILKRQGLQATDK